MQPFDIDHANGKIIIVGSIQTYHDAGDSIKDFLNSTFTDLTLYTTHRDYPCLRFLKSDGKIEIHVLSSVGIAFSGDTKSLIELWNIFFRFFNYGSRPGEEINLNPTFFGQDSIVNGKSVPIAFRLKGEPFDMTCERLKSFLETNVKTYTNIELLKDEGSAYHYTPH
jgi:hypothetical protein